MASIERTAYPRFKRVTSARELDQSFTPTPDEIAWAQGLTRSSAHLLALVVALKSFQRLGHFPAQSEVPDTVVDHVRRTLEVEKEATSTTAARTVRQHRSLIRERLGVVSDPGYARKLAESAIYAAAQAKDNPADLINVALEELVRARCEIPGYSTLDGMAARIRAEVNGALFARILLRMSGDEVRGLEGLLQVDPTTRQSPYDALKQPAVGPRNAQLSTSPSTFCSPIVRIEVWRRLLEARHRRRTKRCSSRPGKFACNVAVAIQLGQPTVTHHHWMP